MYSIRRIEYILLIFLKVKPSYSCQCASLTLLMLDLFLYNAKMDILRRKVYANVRNIILKHINYVYYEILCVYYDVWQSTIV